MEVKNSDQHIQTARFTLSLLKIWIHHYSEKITDSKIQKFHSTLWKYVHNSIIWYGNFAIPRDLQVEDETGCHRR